MLPPLNLAHVRTLDPSQRSQLLLGNFLILAKRAHSFTESQGWLGFIVSALSTAPLCSHGL